MSATVIRRRIFMENLDDPKSGQSKMTENEANTSGQSKMTENEANTKETTKHSTVNCKTNGRSYAKSGRIAEKSRA